MTALDSTPRAATEELARRYCERHGIVGGAARQDTAMNARDLGAVRDCITDSCVIEDHCHLRVADLHDRDSHIAMLAPSFELAGDYLVELSARMPSSRGVTWC